jgi:hypothetical protein
MTIVVCRASNNSFADGNQPGIFCYTRADNLVYLLGALYDVPLVLISVLS